MALPSLLALAACSTDTVGVTQSQTRPSYDGIEARLLESDLISVRVALSDATRADALAYAECAAAQYTLDRRANFARHIRTNVAEAPTGIEADAVYLIAQSLPRGSKTIDAEVVVAACSASGIPTV